MDTKTFEEYKKDFEEIRKKIEEENFPIELINEYEQLAKDCIQDYPDEELGYIEYSNVLVAFINEDQSQNVNAQKMIELKNLTKTNYKYIITNELLIKHLNCVGNTYFETDYYDISLIHREKKKEFAYIYYLCGELYATRARFKEAADEFKIATELGIDYTKFIDLINTPISSITIKNEYCIKELHIDNLDNCKEIYLLGENGVGKTVLLQSIIYNIINDTGNIEVIGTDHPNVHNYQNLFAYGTSRFRTGSENDDFFDKTGFDTLFDRHSLLTNPLTWLELVRLKDKAKESPISIHTIIEFINTIINFDANNEFQLKLEDTKFTFLERDTKIEFEHLAEGYRTVLVLLCDLLNRLTKNQPYIKTLNDFYGVVLVDEIDMFLHPKWEYRIIRKLREKLPNIQWFFTTHSPILILGASDDAIFYKLYKNDKGETQKSEQWKCQDIDNLLSNALITSPLFDMDTARMKSFANSTKELDTSRDYVESRLRIKIDARIEQFKKENYKIERSEIDEIIDQAIAETIKTAQ